MGFGDVIASCAFWGLGVNRSMKKLVQILVLLIGSTSLAAASEGLVIGSEARCMQSRGIPINEVPDNQVKWACLKDQNVQRACNPDGAHARFEAFRQWQAQLMEFQERCQAVGGVFAFADAGFQAPSDSSFCSLAEPVVSYSEFETPMCNFVSRCPRVAVTCATTEEVLRNVPQTVSLPGIPKPIAILR
jgi:hypothetical protein